VTQTDEYGNAQLSVNGDPFTAVAYNGGKGNWRLDNIVFHGSSLSAVEPEIVSTQVGDGTEQRSTVGSISVTLNTLVNTVNSDAWTLYQEVLNSDGSINTGAAPVNVSSGITETTTTVGGASVLTFSVTPGGSLDRTNTDAGFFVNGIYQLQLDGTDITDAGTGLTGIVGTTELQGGLLAPVTFASNETESGTSQYFHVLFGDLTGTAFVNAVDYRTFARDYLSQTGDSNYNVYLDYDGTGIVNAISYRKFATDYLQSYTY
jgi:hypothetical protein